MAAIYAVYTSPTHPHIANHLPTLIVTPHGQPSNILYSYLHTNYNAENYLLTPSPQGDLCVAKLFPPRPPAPNGSTSASDPGHSSGSRVVRCEASRNLKWSIANTGVISPIYKLSLPSPDSPDLPLFQISKPNPNAAFWSMFYFAYAGHNIPPKRIEFGKIQKNPPGPNGGGTRISITGKTPEEKAVWQTLGEGNEDCVEWVVLCAALNLLDDEIIKAAEKNSPPPAQGAGPISNQGPQPLAGPGVRTPVTLRDPGTASAPSTQSRGPPSAQQPSRGPPSRPPPLQGHSSGGYAPGQGSPPPPQGYPSGNHAPGPGPPPPPQGYHPSGSHVPVQGPHPGPGYRPGGRPPPQTRNGGLPNGQMPNGQGYGRQPPNVQMPNGQGPVYGRTAPLLPQQQLQRPF